MQGPGRKSDKFRKLSFCDVSDLKKILRTLWRHITSEVATSELDLHACHTMQPKNQDPLHQPLHGLCFNGDNLFTRFVPETSEFREFT